MKKNNRMEMVESFQACFNNATVNQQNGMKQIVALIGESIMIDCLLINVSRINPSKTISFSQLMSSITTGIGSETLYGMFMNDMTEDDQKDFEARITSRNIYINSRIKNRDHNAKNNLLPIIMKMGQTEIPSRREYRKLFSAKTKKFIVDKMKKIVSVIRPMLIDIVENYNDKKEVFTRELVIKGKKSEYRITGCKPVSSCTSYMMSSPGTIGDMKCRLGNETNNSVSLMTQSIEMVLNMPFTFDNEYNEMIEAIVNEPILKTLLAGKSTDEQAINAKLAQAQMDIEEGLEYWNELGKGNVYFKYVIDFRGRISQLGGLSAVGNKVGKSMVRSGHAHELGEYGYDEILIALAGAVGYDKETFNVRLSWAKENVNTYEEIGRHLIADPVRGFNMLLDCDDPFAAATICLELVRISEHEGEVNTYCSNIFIGYDATSSAVQLVGLLMGNEKLTEASNVRVGKDTEDKIHDSYMLLADIMDVAAPKLRDEDNEEAIDMWLGFDPKTKRSFAKPLLMTRLYGSKFLTHMDSARDIVVEKGLIDSTDTKKLKTFGKGIATLFNKAFDNEEGFNCLRSYENFTKEISRSYNSIGQDTIWSLQDTSTFEPQKVVSVYRKFKGDAYKAYFDGKKHTVRTYGLDIIGSCMQELDYNEDMELAPRKATSAIAPNFIHSHDALVLHSTVLKLNKPMRLTHDCFATTPGMVTKMQQAISEVYVELFGDNKLNQIEALQEECYNNTGILVDLPENFNRKGIPTSEIKSAIYKFS